MDNPMLSLKARLSQMCPNCREPTSLVDDHATGDLICEECGAVLESHVIDESAEWRNFADGDKSGPNRDRAGGPRNRFLDDGGVGTNIGMGQGSHVAQLQRTHEQRSDKDRTLKKAFIEIGIMCERLSLPEAVKERAREVYNDIYRKKAVKNRNRTAVFAACIYIACRQENIPRSFKEVTPVATDTNKVEIWRVFKAITDKLDIKQDQMGVVNAAAFVERWSSLLGLSGRTKKAVKEVVEVAAPSNGAASVHRAWGTRVPQSVAAAVLYLTAAVGGEPLEVDDIALKTGVAAGTIQDVYAEMYGAAEDLIPEWFAGKAAVLKSKPLKR